MTGITDEALAETLAETMDETMENTLGVRAPQRSIGQKGAPHFDSALIAHIGATTFYNSPPTVLSV
jgi:hypothetical protein